MSESEVNPQILVNDEAEGQQQGDAAPEKQSSSASLDEECPEDGVASEREMQPKMQSVLQQVRNQIRSQGSRSSIQELIQKVRDNRVKVAQVMAEDQEQPQEDTATAEVLDEECTEDGVTAENLMQAKMHSALQQLRNQIRSELGVQAPRSSIMELIQNIDEIKLAQAQADDEKQESKTEMDEKELCAFFDEKLEAGKKVLRDEFQVQISQIRAEMRAYTDQTLKDFESKMQSCSNVVQPKAKKKPESRCPEKKQKPTAPPSLAARRGSILTRTMTTIIPKTCAPVIVGQRAKSEPLCASKSDSSKPLPRDPVFPLPYSKSCQNCKPLLPPAYPRLQQHKKPFH